LLTAGEIMTALRTAPRPALRIEPYFKAAPRADVAASASAQRRQLHRPVCTLAALTSELSECGVDVYEMPS